MFAILERDCRAASMPSVVWGCAVHVAGGKPDSVASQSKVIVTAQQNSPEAYDAAFLPFHRSVSVPGSHS